MKQFSSAPLDKKDDKKYNLHMTHQDLPIFNALKMYSTEHKIPNIVLWPLAIGCLLIDGTVSLTSSFIIGVNELFNRVTPVKKS